MEAVCPSPTARATTTRLVISMEIRQSSTLLSGILFSAIGLVCVTLSFGYHIGTAGRMGPGYFPLIVGIITALLGAILVVSSFQQADEAVGRIGLRPIACTLLAIASFGALIESGLIPATMTAIIIASHARRVENYVEMLLVSAGFAAFSAFVFVYAIGLPMRLFPV